MSLLLTALPLAQALLAAWRLWADRSHSLPHECYRCKLTLSQNLSIMSIFLKVAAAEASIRSVRDSSRGGYRDALWMLC